MDSWQTAAILLRQCVEIFLLFSVGVLLRRIGMVTVPAARQMCNMVMLVIAPALVISMLQRPFYPALVPGILTAALATGIFYLISLPLTRLVFGGKGENAAAVKRIACISSNVGFVGIPLVNAVMGEQGLLYVAIYIILFNIHIWTHGIMLLRGESRIRWKEVLTCPVLIASVAGILLFIAGIQLPLVISETIDYMCAMNTPLPTILTGVFIGELSLQSAISDRRVHLPCLMRLVVLPMLFVVGLWAIRLPHWFAGADTIALVMVLCAACPAGTVSMMLPARLGQDATFGSNIIAQSNLFCILTIPLVAVIAKTMFAW